MASIAAGSIALPISTRDVIEREGAPARTLHVFCPMRRRTGTIEGCLECPFCKGFEPGDGTRSFTLCAFQSPANDPPERPVGSVLARFTTCVRVDAVGRPSMDAVLGGAAPVVDAQLRLVGTLEPGPRVQIGGRAAFAIEETAPLASALSQLARQRRRQAPVVSCDGAVVGSIDDLAALQALRGPSGTP